MFKLIIDGFKDDKTFKDKFTSIFMLFYFALGFLCAIGLVLIPNIFIIGRIIGIIIIVLYGFCEGIFWDF